MPSDFNSPPLDFRESRLRDLRPALTSGEHASGNHGAFARTFLPLVHGLAVLLIPENPDAAANVTRVVFELVHVRKAKFRGRTLTAAWVFQSTLIACRKERQRLREIYRELVEINTTDSSGDNTRAARAMADRLLAAGLPAADVQVLVHPGNPTKGNLVARLRGDGSARPLLLLAHLDVVELCKSLKEGRAVVGLGLFPSIVVSDTPDAINAPELSASGCSGWIVEMACL